MNRRVLYGRGLNLAAQLTPSRQSITSFTQIESMRGASIRKIGCGYLQSYYLLCTKKTISEDGQFVKTGYFMDSLTSIRIINMHRLFPKAITLFQKMIFLGQTLSFRGGDENPTLFNKQVGPFDDMWFGISRVYGQRKQGIYAMGQNYFGQLGTRNTINFEHTFTKLPSPEKQQIKGIGCGFQHTFLTYNDKLFGCGKASDYQCQPLRYTQNNDLSDKIEIPELIHQGQKIHKAAGGLKFSLIWVEGNRLLAMGDNKFGQCGQNNLQVPEVKKLTQVLVEWQKDQTILDIACGFCHSLILTNKYVYFMGSIEQKQNPFKTFNQNICTPVPLPIQNPRKIFAAFDRSAVINSKGQAFIFGGKDYSFCGGQSGDLQRIEGLSNESQIGLGFSHTLLYL